jgi:hypothetical protein
MRSRFHDAESWAAEVAADAADAADATTVTATATTAEAITHHLPTVRTVVTIAATSLRRP